MTGSFHFMLFLLPNSNIAQNMQIQIINLRKAGFVFSKPERSFCSGLRFSYLCPNKVNPDKRLETPSKSVEVSTNTINIEVTTLNFQSNYPDDNY